MKSNELGKNFFNRSVLDVARDMLGLCLCKKDAGGQITRMIINETEAYDGEKDLACHASKGKTSRNEVMYGPAGVIYLYLCYGMHWLLNIVCREEEYPAAVLIRGTLDVSGPGRLTKKLGINGELNLKTANFETGLWFEKSDLKKITIEKGPRIGVDFAGKYWAEKPYRFWFSKPKTDA